MADQVQLLNLQHNSITRIQHLSHLHKLVLLNLNDNHISEMTGIEALCSLRVLLLGKNRWVQIIPETDRSTGDWPHTHMVTFISLNYRIQKICCLASLSNLSILDLHDNQVWSSHL